MRAGNAKLRNAINHVDREAKPIDLVLDRQVQRGVDVTLLLVTAHVQIAVIRPAIRESMDQPRVAVEVEDDRLVGGEQRIKVAIRQTMRMLAGRREAEQIDDVDEANLQIGEMLA